MSVAEAKETNIVNGIDVDALSGVIEEVKKDPAKGVVEFRVTSAWKGQSSRRRRSTRTQSAASG
jgi:hypothetical protein